MKILITGVAGFIGSHLAQRLLSEGYEVIGIDNFDRFYDRKIKEGNLGKIGNHQGFEFIELDLSYEKSVVDLPKVDVVIHLAAKAGVRPSIDAPLDYIQHNVKATCVLLDWIKTNEIKKFIFASSSSVYGNSNKIPFNEEDNINRPISPYAFSKVACEQMNYTYHDLYGIDIINLRFFTVYGPGQRPDLAIHKFVRLISEDKPISVYGDGGTARDYTFVTDTVDGIFRALQYINSHQSVFEIINLGNNSPVKLIDLVKSIYKVMDKEPRLEYLPMQPGDVEITFADISKAQRLLGYDPQTTIESGLKKFVEWYKAK